MKLKKTFLLIFIFVFVLQMTFVIIFNTCHECSEYVTFQKMEFPSPESKISSEARNILLGEFFNIFLAMNNMPDNILSDTDRFYFQSACFHAWKTSIVHLENDINFYIHDGSIPEHFIPIRQDYLFGDQIGKSGFIRGENLVRDWCSRIDEEINKKKSLHKNQNGKEIYSQAEIFETFPQIEAIMHLIEHLKKAETVLPPPCSTRKKQLENVAGNIETGSNNE